MSLTFVLSSLIVVISVALCIGTAIKFWHYGIRDLLLLSSPFMAILILLVLPLLVFNLLIFHPERIIKKSKSDSILKKELENASLAKRLRIGIFISYVLARFYPLFVGIAADIIFSVSSDEKIVWNRTFDLNTLIRKFIQELTSMYEVGPGGFLKRMV